MDHHTDTLTIDAPEGCIEADADFAIAADWSGFSYLHKPRLIGVSDCKLTRWTFNGRDMTREHALMLMDESTLRRQEAMAAEAWCEAVERGEAA